MVMTIIYAISVSMGGVPFNPWLFGLGMIVDLMIVANVVQNMGGNNEVTYEENE